MAMLPFCGYNMGDYFAHWLKIGAARGAQLPQIFYVNWFRKDADGKFLWPGYGENSRVLAWVFARCAGHGEAVETPIGCCRPSASGGIDTNGLDISDEAIAQLMSVDVDGWKAQLPQIHAHFAKFGDTLPQALRDELAALEQRLSESK